MTPDRSPRRRSLLFLLRFGAILFVLSATVALRPVDEAVVVPFTAAIARVSGALLGALGEPVRMAGTEIHSSAFAVRIENGCNGLETVLLFAAAVMAFPAPWKWRVFGLAAGFAAIELVNLIRVASLVWIGGHRPALFSASHTLLWQSLVVLFGVALFLAWAARSPRPGAPAAPASP